MKTAPTIRLLLCTLLSISGWSQTAVNVSPGEHVSLVSPLYRPGVFYVPKTAEAQDDFLGNDIYQNCIRTHVIESVLNNATNLEEALDLLDGVEPILTALADKTDRMLFIFEKMPAWLSSSDDGSPASTPGWFVLNTVPPESWDEWSEAVAALTDRIWNDYGMTNAAFEIWNEPDLGSWTASNAAFFELFEVTYDAVKEVNNDIPVGGPAVNHWGNNIEWFAAPGYTTYEGADSSLIAEVLEWSEETGKPLDIISWHLFGINIAEHALAEAYIRQKCETLGIPVPELVISEWNAPSVVRESPLARSFMIASALEIGNTGATHQVVAAWQDFEETPEEFHQDYGMITYGAIHKPAYYSLLLLNELKGAICELETHPYEIMQASVFEDTAYVLISNYCPDPFAMALFTVFYEGELNAFQLDEAGYIDLETGDFSTLIGVFEDGTELPEGDPVNDGINLGIPVYAYFQGKETEAQNYVISFEGYAETYAGSITRIGEAENNMKWKYDSLLTEGYTQETARTFLQENQELSRREITVSEGAYALTLEPNDVALLKVGIDGVGAISETEKQGIVAYPNPTDGVTTISGVSVGDLYYLVDVHGKIQDRFQFVDSNTSLDLSGYAPGIYYLQSSENPKQIMRLVKY